MKYLFILFFALLSCSKTGNEHNFIVAKVINSCPGCLGSCGWQIVINDTQYYHPDYLPPTVKKDNLSVLVTYLTTKDTFYCGDIALIPYQVLHIISIMPK